MDHTLADQVAVEQLRDGEFVSKVCPITMGNSLPIAYGGCTIAVAVSSACATVPAPLALYSVLGHFLGPASTKEKLHCVVQKVRDTRSFATRRVQVKQKQPDGSVRTCLELTADFQAPEPSLLNYSVPPTATYAKPDDCPDFTEQVKHLEEKGVITKKHGAMFIETFKPATVFFETRPCTNGVSAQNMSGAAKGVPTTQDRLHITAKSSAEWQRVREPLKTTQDTLAALSFLMDGGLSFLPLSHNHMWFDDATACSTLDFAFRVFTTDIKLDEWHLRERTTSHGGSGRTFAEGKLWDEKGNLIASTSQQSILRPKKGAVTANL